MNFNKQQTRYRIDLFLNEIITCDQLTNLRGMGFLEGSSGFGHFFTEFQVEYLAKMQMKLLWGHTGLPIKFLSLREVTYTPILSYGEVWDDVPNYFYNGWEDQRNK